VYRNAAAQSRADLGGRLGPFCLGNRAHCGRDCNCLGDDCGSLRYSGAILDVNGTRCDRGQCSRIDSRRSHLNWSGGDGRAFRRAGLVDWRGLFGDLGHRSSLGSRRSGRLVTRGTSCDDGRVLRDIRSADTLQVSSSRLGLIVIIRPSIDALHDLVDEIRAAAVAREVGVVLAVRLPNPGVDTLREEVRGVGSFVSLRRNLDVA
jgi:hypothetical protein